MDKTIPGPAAKLLDLIGSIEAPKGYDTIYGNNQDSLAKPITKMTIEEVLAKQLEFTKNFGSSASGRYQIMRNTLRDLMVELNLRPTQTFDANLQDRLAYHLLRQCGYERWAAGQMSDSDFMLGLAKEWASFPVPYACRGAHCKLTRGQCYYAGDGLNKALVTPEAVEGALALAKAATSAQQPSNIFARLETALRRLFGRD